VTVLQQLRRLVGSELGVGPWLSIDQARIDAFAQATRDHQWIHTDPQRASAGPFGTTIAHGYLTLALLPYLTVGIHLPVAQPRMAINYGLDRVRFPAPVRVGSRIRARVRLDEVGEVAGGIQVKRTVTVEIETEEKPALVAETLTRYLY
jgi:acyl dehydratase